MPNDQVSAAELGEWLGVSRRSISEFAAAGTIVKASRGRYRLQESVQTYAAHLREVAAGRGGEKAQLDLTAERARLAKEQADNQQLKNATLRKEMLPASEVEAEWSDILRRVRSGMLAVPSRVRQQIPTMDTAQAAILDREIRDALEALADDIDYAPEGAGVPTAAASNEAFEMDGGDDPPTG